MLCWWDFRNTCVPVEQFLVLQLVSYFFRVFSGRKSTASLFHLLQNTLLGTYFLNTLRYPLYNYAWLCWEKCIWNFDILVVLKWNCPTAHCALTDQYIVFAIISSADSSVILSSFYHTVFLQVPSAVTHVLFWQRYFYKVHQLQQVYICEPVNFLHNTINSYI